MPGRDLAHNPFIVIWETTRACQLACRHCRAKAVRRRHPEELTTQEAKDLVEQVAAMDKPLLVLTGGDPMERDDLVAIVRHASAAGLTVSLTPSATPRVTPEAMRALQDAGVVQWAFSLDGSTAQVHDRFRGIRGCFDLTLERIGHLRRLGAPLQVNTTVSRHNVDDLPAIAHLVQELGAVRWGVFFLIPTGRARLADVLPPEEHEAVVRWLCDLSGRVPFDIKTTEGPQYYRALAQRAGHAGTGHAGARRAGAGPADDAWANGGPAPPSRRAGPAGVRRSEVPVWDGNGFVFVSHTGDVYPSGFLPVRVGNIRERPLAHIYRTAPELLALRNPSGFRGKCGVCEFNRLCAGSRARAYAVTGDYLASDPACTYVPRRWRERAVSFHGSGG
ncbi:MAG: TIGR04053 family radical SAM/SPASM domain-containing protein [Clostridia bacterium]|nr:TIGR04053 family radical SAM/SPASM domain-containing protein [Clostridia bacterium]